MLHNTGQFGSDVPLNVNAQNMTSINERMNIDNNLAKISHPVPQSSPHFNIPDYGPYGLNMNANLNPYQNFHPIGFQPSNVPNPMHNSWPSNMLPMNLNMHSDQHMLGYQYGKPESFSDHKDLSLNKNLSVPQVQTKAFHKQMGMDVNYPSFKPHFRQYADYNLHLNAKTKPEVHKMDVTPELDRDIVSPHPYYEQNLDLSNKSQKIYSNPYQSIDSTEYNLSCDKNENGRNVGSYDLSTKIPKYTTVLQKPASTYQEQRDPTPPKSTERDYPDNLSVSKPQNVEQNLTTNYQFPCSDIGNRFLKDQDSRRRSLENTVKMIENILSHSSNTRKTDYYSQDDSMDTDTSSKNKKNSKEPEIVSNSNQTDSKPNTPSPSECSNNETSQESTNISDDKADVVPKNDDENKDNITSENNENTNNDNGSHSDSEDSSDCDIKPSIKEIDVKPENDVPIDNSVIIKVEIFPSIVDMEYLNPFHRDIFGIQNEDVANNDIIDSENSINVAKEVIRNGASVKGAYFECPHCNLYFNHPKRFLIHAKWHSFGLTNEKRLELQKEKERRKTMKKEARVVERMKQSEVTEDAPGRKFNCKECDKVFNSKASLKHHRQRYHPTRARDCKICGKTLIGWMAMRAHLTTHTSETGYQCTDCPKRFKHPHSLAKHKDTHLEKTHECAQCPKKFGSAALLNVHMKTHERVLRGATFRCTYCGKGFFESYSLQVHERTHRNERPYHCEICNTSFGTNSSLKRHVKVSHNNAKPFECSTCHRCFISEAIRDRHEIRNHGNPEDFKFLCKQCPCKYLKLKDLRKHMYKSHPKGKRKKKVESDSDYDTSPPRRRAPKSHAERQRRYILRKKQKRLEEYLKEIKNAGINKIEPAELLAVTHFLTNPPPRPPPKTHAERQRLYILRKKQKELEEYMKQTQNASGDNPEAGELSAVASNVTNLQPRPPPKSHAERQRRYMIRKKQKMLEEKLKKAQSTNDDSFETADLSADTSFTSLPSRTSPKTNAERQRDFRLRQKERKFEENDNKSPKKSRAAYLRQYRAKRKLAAMMNSEFVEVVLREETEAPNPETVTTDSLTQLSPDTVV